MRSSAVCCADMVNSRLPRVVAVAKRTGETNLLGANERATRASMETNEKMTKISSLDSVCLYVFVSVLWLLK